MAKKSEKRLAIETMIAEFDSATQPLDSYPHGEISTDFNFQGNAYHAVGFETEDAWISVRFSYIEDMFHFIKWLTTHAHIKFDKLDRI